MYADLSEGAPGLLGWVTARSEAQVIRLALTYALLDASDVIRVPHLEAALALWRYAEASAAYIFGDKIGDGDADKILALLRKAGERGMTRTDIGKELAGNHVTRPRMQRALELLSQHGRIAMEQRRTKGRSEELWRAT
jgi:DNA replicative helicase MCM subunit Mcm2 (Cdc46/Mcm family)